MEKISANEFAILSPISWEKFIALLKTAYEDEESEFCDNLWQQSKALSQPNEFIQNLNDEEFGVYVFYKTVYNDQDYIIVWCTWASGYADEWIVGYNLKSCCQFENQDNIDEEFLSFLSNEFQNIE